MEIKLIPSKYAEASELLKIQKEAFHSDLIKYKDYDTNPAAESLDFFVFRMQSSLHYSIFIDRKLAGGICVIKQSEDHYYLYRIFLSPKFQNKGLGSKILKLLEKQFPQAKKWALDTPKDNRRNRHFYEKFGYKKKDEHRINERLTLIDYEKHLK